MQPSVEYVKTGILPRHETSLPLLILRLSTQLMRNGQNFFEEKINAGGDIQIGELLLLRNKIRMEGLLT